MIIKVNYTVSDIYMSTSVSAVYIKVVYSGVSGGGGTWGSITGTLSNQTDLQDALDDKVPYTGATGAVSLGLFGLTAGTLTLQPQALNSSTYKITQQMASNDYWSIYGFASVDDYGDLYFELQDNAAFADGQRFRFHYGNASSGTPKDILLMDYNTATFDGTIQVNTLAGTGTRMVVSDSQGQLSTQAIPSLSSGGSSINYYLNGSVNSSVAGYKQLGNTATIGAGTDFTLSGNGLIAQFLTDAGNPNRLEIPGGAWNFEMFFQVSSSGGNQKFYVELLKYDGTTFTSIASSSAIPEEITGGTAIDLYLTSLAVPTTTLLVTDRLAIRVYIVDNSGGRTITLHTEDNTLCEIITTFAGGISALNGLTANTQYFATGTSGSSFNIVSVGDTHTFNFPSGGGGSMAIGGAITSATAGSVLFAGTSGVLAQDNANFFWDDVNNRLGIGTATPLSLLNLSQAGTSTGVNSIIRLENTTTATAIGQGVAQDFYLTDNIGVKILTSRISSVWSNISNAAQFGDLVFSTVNYNSLRESLRITANGNVIIPFPASGQSLTVAATNSINWSASGATTSGVVLGSGNTGGSIFVNTPSGIGNSTNNQYNSGIGFDGSAASYVSTINIKAFGPKISGGSSILTFSTTTDTILNERMRITASGRLLIGTTSESTYILDVNGTARVSGDMYTNGAMYVQTTTASFTGKLYQVFKASGTSGAAMGFFGEFSGGSVVGYGFSDNAGNQIMQIRNNGDVTIQTGGTFTASGFKLDVNGTTRFQGNSVIASTLPATLGSGNRYLFTFFGGVINGSTTQNNLFISNNGYFNGTNNVRKNAGYANGMYLDELGNTLFTTSASSTAGSTITYSEIIRFTNTSNVLVGTTTDVASSKLTIESTTQGFLPPRMTTTQRDAISSPATGLIVYNTTLNSKDFYDGATWRTDADTITTNRQTASYSLVLADRGKLVEMNVATANNLTIPLNSSIAFPIGSKIDVTQYGAGQTTIVATGGVTIRSFTSYLKLAGQYAACTLVKIGTDEWYCYGNLIA